MIETERMTKAIQMLPNATLEAVAVIELGSGYGRNYSLLRASFPHAIIGQYE